MSELRLEELSAKNVVAANGLTMKPGQEAFVLPLSNSIYITQSTTWTRVVYRDDEILGYFMANFDPEAEQEIYRSSVLRMNVAAAAQGSGIGSFIVEQIGAEGAKRGFDSLYAVWEPGELGPEKFFTKVGFEVVGETEYGEQIGKLTLV